MRSPPAIRIRPARRVGVRERLLRVAPAALLAYWPLDERAGTVAFDASGNARNGAYTNVALGASGIGDGRAAASFNGTTSYCNVYSASLAASFNGAEGTIALWAKVSAAGVWTEGALRRLIYLQADTNNRVILQRSTINGTIEGVLIAGGVGKTAVALTTSPAGFFHAAITWSKSADQLKAFVAGAQIGATLTGLGVFVGALAIATTCIGSVSTTPTTVWSGSIAHVALWNTALSPAQIALLSAAP